MREGDFHRILNGYGVFLNVSIHFSMYMCYDKGRNRIIKKNRLLIALKLNGRNISF